MRAFEAKKKEILKSNHSHLSTWDQKFFHYKSLPFYFHYKRHLHTFYCLLCASLSLLKPHSFFGAFCSSSINTHHHFSLSFATWCTRFMWGNKEREKKINFHIYIRHNYSICWLFTWREFITMYGNIMWIYMAFYYANILSLSCECLCVCERTNVWWSMRISLSLLALAFVCYMPSWCCVLKMCKST